MERLVWMAILVMSLAKLHSIEANAPACRDRYTWCKLHESQCDKIPSMRKGCQKTCNACSNNCDPDALGCEYTCAQTNTGPVCTCPSGLTLHANQRTCVDIDECLGENPCPEDRPVCVNHPGTFFCKERPLCNLQRETTFYYNRTNCCQRTQNTCGQNTASEGTRLLGSDAILALWPWTAFVKGPTTFCTGVLINEEWVVAPAHCFGPGEAGTTQVTLGMRSTTQGPSNFTVNVSVSSITPHPAYDYPSNDIALIRLAQPVAFSQFVRPICLPGGELPEEDSTCVFSGYETEFYEGGLRRTMQESGMFIRRNSECLKNLPGFSRSVDEHQLCAEHDRFAVSSCPGESGGPLVCQRCNSCDWYLAGISSYGGACPDSEAFGMFTSVESYENWIAAVANMNSTSNYACRNSGTAWRPWGAWSACDKTCGSGLRSRTRECNRGNAGSSFGCAGLSEDVTPCNLRTCPRWGRYSQWSSCSKQCGGGRQTRQRFCMDGLIGEGGCLGSATISRPCNVKPCGWTKWGNWGGCSATCGTEARKTRKRECLGGEGKCNGSPTSTTSCNFAVCPGEWSEWSNWSRCSKTCGGGIRVRGRSCENGNRCPGTDLGTEPCGEDPCPEMEPCSNVSNKISGSLCRGDPGWCVRFPSFMGRNCARTCCLYGPIEGYSDWSAWSECSQTCGGGVLTRERSCDEPDRCHDIIPTRITKDCDAVACNRLQRTYSDWGNCSATCGGGERTRQAALCDEEGECTVTYETEACATQKCPPRWRDWGPWGDCSATCGVAYRERARVCVDGEAESDQCVGLSTEREKCDNEPCEGIWSDWSGWNNCNATCGDGWQRRMRHCTTGDNCIGPKIQQQTCNAGACANAQSCENKAWDSVCDIMSHLCDKDDVVSMCKKTCGGC